MAPGRGKQKGNAFERKIAKVLSTWIFKDDNILWRDSTSGGRKKVYNGDIVPENAHAFPWGTWPFHFELKTGYPDHVPTLINQNKVREWLCKLMDELTETQHIPMLIAQFTNLQPILITSLVLDFYCDVMMVLTYKGYYYHFYVYNFNQLMNADFKSVMPDIVLDHIKKMTEFKMESFKLQFDTPQTPDPIIQDIDVVDKSKRTRKKSKKKEDEYDAIGEVFRE